MNIQFHKIINRILDFASNWMRGETKESNEDSKYSDFDYESLTQLYFDNKWLRHQVNIKGFEDLWFDYSSKSEKQILLKLLNDFTYLSVEDAEIEVKEELKKCIKKWNISASDTLFIGFQKHKYPDGSQVLLNFFKPIFAEIDPNWREHNFLPNFDYGLDRIKKDGFKRFGLDLKNIVLVDDFVGTGGTVEKRIVEIRKLLKKEKKDFKLKVFTVAGMEEGIKKIKNYKIECSYVYCLSKASKLWNPLLRNSIKRQISDMEGILFEGTEVEPLSKYNLGYGQSETIYSLSRFNLPNNNLPILWWNRYRGGAVRKPLFNRLQ